MSGSTPKCWGWKSGVQRVPVRNSTGETTRKNPAASIRSTATIPTVVSTDTTLHATRIAPMTRSWSRIRALRRSAPYRPRGSPPGAAAIPGGTIRPALAGPTRRLQPTEVLAVRCRFQRSVPGLRDERLRVLHVETEERADLRPLQRSPAHVQEQRPRERPVRAGADRLGRRRHATFPAIHRDRPEPLPVLLVVCVAEVTERVPVPSDALDQH